MRSVPAEAVVLVGSLRTECSGRNTHPMVRDSMYVAASLFPGLVLVIQAAGSSLLPLVPGFPDRPAG